MEVTIQVLVKDGTFNIVKILSDHELTLVHHEHEGTRFNLDNEEDRKKIEELVEDFYVTDNLTALLPYRG